MSDLLLNISLPNNLKIGLSDSILQSEDKHGLYLIELVLRDFKLKLNGDPSYDRENTQHLSLIKSPFTLFCIEQMRYHNTLASSHKKLPSLLLGYLFTKRHQIVEDGHPSHDII